MGFAAGFQVGAQAVERGIKMREEDELKRNLAQESGRYNVTEGAYGPGLQENINQLQGLREQDPAQAPAYDQAIAELTRRQGLTAPDYSVASGATNYATRQEARQAAAPMRTEGLSGVYRQAGMIDKADELENRAFEQQRAMAAEGRAVSAEGRAVSAEGRAAQEFGTNQTKTGLQIKQLTRTEAEQQRETDFSSYVADNPDMPVKDLKETAFKQFKFSPAQWQKVVTTRLGIENAEMDSFKNNIRKKLQGKNLTQLGSLYNSDPDFDDKTDLAIVPGKNGAVTLNFIDKTTKAITGTQTFKNEALATEYLNKQATEPETIGSWMMSLRKTESAIDANQAQIRASDSTVGLNAQRANQIKQMNAAMATNLKNSDEAKALQSEYASLDDTNDPGGAKRNSLLNQFNMLSVKAGGTIPLGGKQKTGLLSQPVEQKKNDDGTYTAFAKDGGRPLYNTYLGEEIPLGMGVSDYQGLKDAAKKNGVSLVTGEDNGKLVVKFAGADGKYYDDVEKAKYAKPAPVGTPAAPASGIDTSRTVVSSTLPTAPTAKPVRDPGEPFTEFRNRTVAWDQNRIAYDRYLKEQELKGLLEKNASGLGKRPLVQ